MDEITFIKFIERAKRDETSLMLVLDKYSPLLKKYLLYVDLFCLRSCAIRQTMESPSLLPYRVQLKRQRKLKDIHRQLTADTKNFLRS